MRPPKTTGLDTDYSDSFEKVPAADWDRLAASAGHVFASREWLATWWRHFGGSRRRLIASVREGPVLAAIVPVYEWRSRGLPVLRLIGHGVSDQLGPVCEPQIAAPGLAAALQALPLRRFVFLAEQLPAGTGFDRINGAVPMYREQSPVITLDEGTWDEFLARRSGNFRRQVGRYSRRLESLGTVSFRVTSDPAQLGADFDVLLRLHRLRWGAAMSPFLSAAAFHREFAAIALRRGWLRLWILEVDGRPVAASYGFRFGNTESGYQSGRDPSFRESQLGFLLLNRAVREALTDGMREYRLLRGGEAYKVRLATGDPGLETIALARGAAARGALTIAMAARGRSLGLRRMLDTS
jgi:CelD/BcsL family acetyltransferase involved in cellulose biosynthesis